MIFPDDDPRRHVWTACESPIEQMLCVGLFTSLGCKAVAGPFNRSRLSQLGNLAGEKPAAFLFSQHPIGAYRVDFLLVLVDPRKRTARLIVIECDGRDYHSRPEQIDRDQRRDAEILEAGCHEIVRFAGRLLVGEMRDAITEIENRLRDRGVETSPDGYAWFLDLFTPSRKTRQARREQARVMWETDEELLRDHPRSTEPTP